MLKGPGENTGTYLITDVRTNRIDMQKLLNFTAPYLHVHAPGMHIALLRNIYDHTNTCTCMHIYMAENSPSNLL